MGGVLFVTFSQIAFIGKMVLMHVWCVDGRLHRRINIKSVTSLLNVSQCTVYVTLSKFKNIPLNTTS